MNISIAEMLGATKINYANNSVGYLINGLTKNGIEGDPKNLKFHNDSNWQMFGLNQMYNKGYDWRLSSGNYCVIINPDGVEILDINLDPKECNAAFFALWQLSQIKK